MLSPGTWNGKESYFKLIEKAISQVRLEELVTPLAEVWEQTRRELVLFLDSLNE